MAEEKTMKNAEAQFFLFKKTKKNISILEILYYISKHWLFLQNTSFFNMNVALRLYKHYIKPNMHFKTLKASYIATCLCLSQDPKLV